MKNKRKKAEEYAKKIIREVNGETPKFQDKESEDKILKNTNDIERYEIEKIEKEAGETKESEKIEETEKVKEETVEKEDLKIKENTEIEKKGIEETKKGIKKRGTLVERYKINSENSTEVDIEIRKEGLLVTYVLKVPEIDVATKALLEEVRNDLITTTTIGMNEIVNPDALDEIRRRFL